MEDNSNKAGGENYKFPDYPTFFSFNLTENFFEFKPYDILLLREQDYNTRLFVLTAFQKSPKLLQIFNNFYCTLNNELFIYHFRYRINKKLLYPLFAELIKISTGESKINIKLLNKLVFELIETNGYIMNRMQIEKYPFAERHLLFKIIIQLLNIELVGMNYYDFKKYPNPYRISEFIKVNKDLES